MAKLTFGLVLLVGLLASVDLRQLLDIWSSSRKNWVLLCLLGAFVIILYQGFLLGLVSSPFAKIPIGRLFLFTMIGRFFSLFLPSYVGGDMVKAVYLFPYFISPSKAYAAIIAHRSIGGLSSLLVAIIACILFLPARFGESMFLAGAVMLTGLVVAVTLWIIYRRALVQKLKSYKGNESLPFVLRTAVSLVSAVGAYRHKLPVLVVVFGLSVVNALLVAIMYILLAATLNLALTFPQALVASSATALSVLVPLTPGGVGVGEGAFVLVSGLMGVPAEQALAITIFGRLLGYICSLPGGIIYLLTPMRQRLPTSGELH